MHPRAKRLPAGLAEEFNVIETAVIAKKRDRFMYQHYGRDEALQVIRYGIMIF